MNAMAALIVDIVDSREIADFPTHRDRVLARFSRRHRQRDWCDADYAVTAWDEFQGLVTAPAKLPEVVWDLLSELHPMRVRLAIGGGRVQRSGGQGAINQTVSGEAFYLAREAMESLRQTRRGAGRVNIRMQWNDPVIEAAGNGILRLVDVLVGQLTDRQWQVIRAFESSGKQSEAARVLKRSESTVSRSLASARYWEMRASLADLGDLLDCVLNSASDGSGA